MTPNPATTLPETAIDPPPKGTLLRKTVGDIKAYHRPFVIGHYGPGLQDIALIAANAAEALLDDIEKKELHCYLNPGWIVKAPGTTEELEFLKEADRCCCLWMTQLRHTLGNGPVKRMVAKMDANAGCLATCGVLFVAGREAHIKRLNWRATQTTR
jgi:hypothetical protein